MSENLFNILSKACEGNQDKEFLVTSNYGTASYAEFFDRAGRYAAALQACGVAKGVCNWGRFTFL